MFSGTIKDAIAYSDDDEKDYDFSMIKSACAFAAIDKDIEEFEDGYDTELKEKGSTVSGGQRQRMSIARAVYKNPKLLVLDDSLSAVDANTEKEIVSNLRALKGQMTTVIVTSRVSTIENCDEIIVMDKGSVVATGNYEELLKSCEYFKDIVELQRLKEEVRS